MKLKKHIIIFSSLTILFFVLLFSRIGARPIGAESIKGNSQKLLEAASAELGIPVTSLEIVNEGVLSLPYLNAEFPTAKVRDREADMIYEVTLDTNGQRVNKDSLLAKDMEIKKARYDLPPITSDSAEEEIYSSPPVSISATPPPPPLHQTY